MTTRALRTAIAITATLLMASAVGAQTPTGACFDVESCSIGPDRPASLLVFPKVVVDLNAGIDTVIQIANTSDQPVGVRCSYLNANGHCSNTGDVCRTSADCGGASCVAGWSETDFRVTLTRLQPLTWNASQGRAFLPCDPFSGQSCAQPNDGRIAPVPETPFVGELKCVQVDDNDAPVDFNEIVGTATIIGAPGDALDAAKYGALGVQSIPGNNDHDNRLCLGGMEPSELCPSGAEYAGCPQTLIMDHLFDGASPGNTPAVKSRMTLVPCSENLLDPQNGGTPLITVQFLIFNEFEQRTSTSVRFRCLIDRALADIDTSSGSADDAGSIFHIGTQATLAGQTRITGVGGAVLANGLLGLLEESRPCDSGPNGICTAAVNMHQQGRRFRSDVIELP